MIPFLQSSGYILLSNMKLNNLHNIGVNWLLHTLNSWGIRESTDPRLPFLSEDIAMLTSSIQIRRSKVSTWDSTKSLVKAYHCLKTNA